MVCHHKGGASDSTVCPRRKWQQKFKKEKEKKDLGHVVRPEMSP